MNLKKIVRDRVKELGDKAPEYFGYSQRTIEGWLKGRTIPLKAIEKALQNVPVVAPGAATSVQTPPPQPDQGPPNAEPPTALQVGGWVEQVVNHLNTNISPKLDAHERQFGFIEQNIRDLAANLRTLSEWKASIDARYA